MKEIAVVTGCLRNGQVPELWSLLLSFTLASFEGAVGMSSSSRSFSVSSLAVS